MNLTAWDLAAITFYFLATAIFAYLTRRTRTFSEFSVGNRQVPGAMVFASLAATIIGPGFSVGFTSKGYTGGYAFYVLALTYGLQTVLCGLIFAPKLNRFTDCHTIGDVMEKRYGRFAHFLSGVISVGLCIGFTAVMGKTAGMLLHAVTGWSLLTSVAMITMLTAAYTFTGGVRAVIATDAMHFTWYTLIIPAMLLVAFSESPRGVEDLTSRASDLTQSGFSALTPMQMLGVAISFLFGETLIPPYTNRALAARSASASRFGFVAAGVFCVIWLPIVASLGILAHDFVPTNIAPDDTFVALGSRLLPPGIFGLLLAAVIAIVMSSQESVLNSATVSLVRDIIDVRRNLGDRAALQLSRFGVLLIAVASVWVSVYSPSIIDGLLICYSIWAPTVLLPFLIALYWDAVRPTAGVAAMLGGGVTSILWQTVWREPFGIPAILAGLSASVAGYIMGYLYDRSVDASGD